MHSYDLSAIVGLATQLVRVMGVDIVHRCVSITLEYHGRSPHDEMRHDGDCYTIYVTVMFAIYKLIEVMDQEGFDLWRTHTGGLCGIGMDILVTDGCWDGRLLMATMNLSGARCKAPNLRVVLARMHDGGV